MLGGVGRNRWVSVCAEGDMCAHRAARDGGGWGGRAGASEAQSARVKPAGIRCCVRRENSRRERLPVGSKEDCVSERHERRRLDQHRRGHGSRTRARVAEVRLQDQGVGLENQEGEHARKEDFPEAISLKRLLEAQAE